MLAPGYTANDVSGRSEPEPRVQTAADRDTTAVVTKVWGHISDVSTWREIFRGTSQGHAFAGSANATVSTRISASEVLGVLDGSVDWSALGPGATVSQLIYTAQDPSQWVVAYIAERNDKPPAATRTQPSDDVSFYIVAPDGRIDASAHDLCASCHGLKSAHAR